MAINFNSLPSTKPQNTVPNGFYQATIIKAEMKRSNTSGNPYLSLQYDLTDGKGTTGKLFDLQMESEKEFLRYKLQRFLNALQLNLQGTFELKDLCKLVVGKKIIVDVTTEDNAQYGARNAVNSFEHEVYYPLNEWASLTAETSIDDVLDDSDVPFDTSENTSSDTINAADATDAVSAGSNEEY